MCGPEIVGGIPTFLYFETIFSRVVGYLLALGGVIFFFMLVSGGFKYLTSAGDPKAISAAHTTLTTAIMGLVLSILAVSILAFIEYITGANVSTFKIVQC